MSPEYTPMQDRLLFREHLKLSYWTEHAEYAFGFTGSYFVSMAGLRFELTVQFWRWTLNAVFTPKYVQSKGEP